MDSRKLYFKLRSLKFGRRWMRATKSRMQICYDTSFISRPLKCERTSHCRAKNKKPTVLRQRVHFKQEESAALARGKILGFKSVKMRGLRATDDVVFFSEHDNLLTFLGVCFHVTVYYTIGVKLSSFIFKYLSK